MLGFSFIYDHYCHRNLELLVTHYILKRLWIEKEEEEEDEEEEEVEGKKIHNLVEISGMRRKNNLTRLSGINNWTNKSL